MNGHRWPGVARSGHPGIRLSCAVPSHGALTNVLLVLTEARRRPQMRAASRRSLLGATIRDQCAQRILAFRLTANIVVRGYGACSTQRPLSLCLSVVRSLTGSPHSALVARFAEVVPAGSGALSFTADSGLPAIRVCRQPVRGRRLLWSWQPVAVMAPWATPDSALTSPRAPAALTIAATTVCARGCMPHRAAT